MSDATSNADLRSLPSVDQLMASEEVSSLMRKHGREVMLQTVRSAVDSVRQRILKGEQVKWSNAVLVDAAEQLNLVALRPVLNATGVVLHTNLGRAPLADLAIERVSQVARGYCNLEMDLDSGERGDRAAPLQHRLRALTGSEDAIVVNNGAAATILVLAALAQGKKVICSRGELVEIGGGFRIPDVMVQSRAQLVEVGTTNRTRLSDYEQAFEEDVSVLMKVHQSNFAMVGFVEEVSHADLAALAKRLQRWSFVDLGSGALEKFDNEPTVREVVGSGIDVVVFSADKLLGGPQAGLIVGKAKALDQMRNHPLYRAFRVDKMTVAALDATLELWQNGKKQHIPSVNFMTQETARIEARANQLMKLLRSAQIPVELKQNVGKVGGGSMPLSKLPSWSVQVKHQKPDALHRILRCSSPSVLGRVDADAVVFDLRCIRDEETMALSQAIEAAWRISPC